MLLESSELFLPKVPLYLDDSNQPDHNPFCGELLAVSEFNTTSYRKIAPIRQLRIGVFSKMHFGLIRCSVHL